MIGLSKLGIKRSVVAGLVLGLTAVASAVVIQGEWAPGVYNNYTIDNFGRMPVVLAGSTGGPMDVAVSSGTVAVSSMPAISGTVGISGIPTVNIGTMPMVVANLPSYSYRNLTANGTTLAKTGAGTLKRIVVNTAGTTSTITVYDSVTGSGTKIGTASSLLAQASIDYDVDFTNGLTVVAAGLTPADITVVYR